MASLPLLRLYCVDWQGIHHRDFGWLQPADDYADKPAPSVKQGAPIAWDKPPCRSRSLPELCAPKGIEGSGSDYPTLHGSIQKCERALSKLRNLSCGPDRDAIYRASD